MIWKFYIAYLWSATIPSLFILIIIKFLSRDTEEESFISCTLLRTRPFKTYQFSFSIVTPFLPPSENTRSHKQDFHNFTINIHHFPTLFLYLFSRMYKQIRVKLILRYIGLNIRETKTRSVFCTYFLGSGSKVFCGSNSNPWAFSI